MEEEDPVPVKGFFILLLLAILMDALNGTCAVVGGTMFGDQFSPGMDGLLSGLLALVILAVLAVLYRRTLVYLWFVTLRRLRGWGADIEDEARREQEMAAPPQPQERKR